MKLTLIQNSLSENIENNIEHVKDMLLSLKDPGDLILLPELFDVPYENEKIKEAAWYDQKALAMLQECARKKKAWILGGSLPFRDHGQIFNRAFLIEEKGNIQASYDKMHLMEVHTTKSDYAECDVFSPGSSFCIQDTPFGRIGILICYDIRFCEPARILASQGVKLLLVPAAFNTRAGKKHWQMLLTCRAMENEIFVAGCNPANYKYGSYQSYGHSLIAGPDGDVLGQLDEKEGILQLEIDLGDIEKVRKRAPYWKVRREDLYACKAHCKRS
jgi:predicted amidohydrolase